MIQVAKPVTSSFELKEKERGWGEEGRDGMTKNPETECHKLIQNILFCKISVLVLFIVLLK